MEDRKYVLRLLNSLCFVAGSAFISLFLFFFFSYYCLFGAVAMGWCGCMPLSLSLYLISLPLLVSFIFYICLFWFVRFYLRSSLDVVCALVL